MMIHSSQAGYAHSGGRGATRGGEIVFCFIATKISTRHLSRGVD